ncbi:MAG TPA: DUF3000 domain-containing protein [Candidatus Microbacterium stercoravium]|uniref:DUF3000 domain-containing protein n=1 Tax=Candidatus Microbacterium stercoravium TaxID=2838697 RepID=A0A9D2H2Z3_9MICO|nr:DUF3000 domain-containing protein [Candidatus Microbacterium stercoravium]
MDVDGGFSRGFEAAAERLRSATFRDDLAVRQIPSPTGLAPDSIAFAADVRPDSHGDSPFGTGRFILLHDPAEPDAWDGAWRIVTFAQAPLEPEIGTDPLLADVAWSWLTDALAERGAACRALAGTATKTVSRGFGSLASQGDGAQIELRASWSPDEPSPAHIDAWAELVCMLAGLPPGSEGIAVLRPGAHPA